MKKHIFSRAIKKGILSTAGLVLILAATGELQLGSASAGSQLKTSYVCMMNNKYLGTEQIPVAVEGKTYYGCCAGCAGTLQNNPQVRTATDPYSGEVVDKADAFIVLKSDATKEVQYFKSEKNYEEYKKLSSSPNMSRATTE
jgi:YHS domain-containing protein